jgi:RNA polymerase sigma-70 factor (ECF subfamily)
MPQVKSDSVRTQGLLELIAAGDANALEQLLLRFQPELVAFVEFRLDPRLRGRFNGSDVVQEAQLETVRRMDDYLKRRPMPFHLWIRKTAYQRLLNLQRDHRRRAKRSVDREVLLPATSASRLVLPLLGKEPSPSAHLAAREQAERVGLAVAKLEENDREILLMRHVEDLPYEEIACLLDIEPTAARKRYGRALIRLQRLLNDFGLLG